MRITGGGVLNGGAWVLALAMIAVPWRPASAQMQPAPASMSGTPQLAPIPFISPHAAHFTVPSARDAWGGPRTAADATLSDEVTSYTLHARLDPARHTVDATERMTWRNRSKRPVRKVYFHLYLNAFANPDSLWFTERRMFSGSGGARAQARINAGQWGVYRPQAGRAGRPAGAMALRAARRRARERSHGRRV